MKKVLSALLIVVMLPLGALAQSSVVSDVKSTLVARGVDLSGSCGAFEITKRVAWRLREQGAGYIRKKVEQNNCQLHGVDIVMFKDGRIVDILTDSGGANGPTWDTSKAPVDPSLWEAPVDPGDGEVTPPSTPGGPIVVTPPSVTIDLSKLEQEVADVRAAQERIKADDDNRNNAVNGKLDALAAQLKAHDESPSFLKKVFTNPSTYAIIGGLLAGKFVLPTMTK